MARLIKRYGSRKLYDTNESRYISLEDIAKWIRDGEEIEVIDNATSEDVTALTLTQVISEEGRKKNRILSSDLLHDLIRTGENVLGNRVKQFRAGLDQLVKGSFDRLIPVGAVREEMSHLRERLGELEQVIEAAEKASQEAAEQEAKGEMQALNAELLKEEPEPVPETALEEAKPKRARRTRKKTAAPPAKKIEEVKI